MKALFVMGLRVDNFMRVRLVELDNLKPGLVEIKGKNRQGKSSLLDGLFSLVTSGRNKHVPNDPVNHDAKRATVRAVLGDGEVAELVVERVFTSSGKTELNLWEAGTFQRLPSPQAKLDALLSTVSVDPGHFATLDAKARGDMLLRILGIGEQLDDIKARRQAVYDQRTEANRRAKEAMDKLRLIDPPADDLPAEPVRIEDIQKQRREAEAAQKAIDAKKVEINAKRDRYKTLREAQADDQLELERIQKRMADRAKQLETIQAEAGELNEELNGLIQQFPQVDVEALDAKIADAARINDSIRARGEYEKAKDHLRDSNKAVSKLERELEDIDAERMELITAAEYPVPGLQYDEETGVLYNGTAFDQLADSEKIRVSLRIVMAEKPGIRVARIKQGSLLDDDSRREVEQICREENVQVFMEIVGETDTPGIIIEDGMLKGAKPKPEPVDAETEDDAGEHGAEGSDLFAN